MSAAGHCGDNAACEGFFGMLKRERVNRKKYRTMDIARADIFNYIERFHNPRMRRRVAKSNLEFLFVLQPSVETGKNQSINSRIKVLISRVRGFRDKERFRNAVYFYLGRLQFYPSGIMR